VVSTHSQQWGEGAPVATTHEPGQLKRARHPDASHDLPSEGILDLAELLATR
jgi:hypothetical protein